MNRPKLEVADVFRKVEWMVYAKPPFGGPEEVLEYVGRYTHRVAISNDHLLQIEDGQVRFRWKDYRHGHQGRMLVVEILSGIDGRPAITDTSCLPHVDAHSCRSKLGWAEPTDECCRTVSYTAPPAL